MKDNRWLTGTRSRRAFSLSGLFFFLFFSLHKVSLPETGSLIAGTGFEGVTIL